MRRREFKVGDWVLVDVKAWKKSPIFNRFVDMDQLQRPLRIHYKHNHVNAGEHLILIYHDKHSIAGESIIKRVTVSVDHVIESYPYDSQPDMSSKGSEQEFINLIISGGSW